MSGRAFRFAGLLLIAAHLLACGQKGPLYLPEPGGAVVVKPPPRSPEPPADEAAPPATEDESREKR